MQKAREKRMERNGVKNRKIEEGKGTDVTSSIARTVREYA